MNGLLRIFFAACAAFALWRAERLAASAEWWKARRDRWRALAGSPAPENTGLGSRPAPGAAGTDGREPGKAGEREG